jgi:hypothetical protein
VTFVIQAQHDINVLLSVVALFNELKVQIEAIWMVRGRHTGNPHISVTVDTNGEGRQKMRNDVSKGGRRAFGDDADRRHSVDWRPVRVRFAVQNEPSTRPGCNALLGTRYGRLGGGPAEFK